MDKGLKRITRARVAVVVAMCVVALFALPAFASAAAPTNVFPADGTTVNQTVSIGGLFTGTYTPAQIAAASVKVDGAGILTSTKTAASGALGTWAVSFGAADADGHVPVTWTWTAGAMAADQVSVFATAKSLTVGAHTAEIVLGADTSGVIDLAVVADGTAGGGGGGTPAAAEACLDCHADGTGGYDGHAGGSSCGYCHGPGLIGPAHGFEFAISGHNAGYDVNGGTADFSALLNGEFEMGWNDAVEPMIDNPLYQVGPSLTATSGMAGWSATFPTSVPATWPITEISGTGAISNFGLFTFPSTLVGTDAAEHAQGPVTAAWDLPQGQVFKAGYDWNSSITCGSCHTGFTDASGPHGSSDNWGLDPAYQAPYGLAELTKYVTANTNYTSNTYQGQALYDSAYKTGGNEASGTATAIAVVKAGVADKWKFVAADFGKPSDEPNSPYFKKIDPTGIAVRLYPDGDGVYRNESGAAISVSDETTAVVVNDKMDIMARKMSVQDGAAGSVICSKCHDLENVVAYGDGRSAVVGSNTAHNSHHQDATDGSAQCVDCHVAIPHGWKRPRLLANSDADAGTSAQSAMFGGVQRMNLTPSGATTISVPATGYYWDKTAGDWATHTVTLFDIADGKGTFKRDQLFTRIGMQSISAIDTHKAMKDYPEYWGISNLNTVNTDDMVGWSEPDCQACNDHPGEGEVRVVDFGMTDLESMGGSPEE